MTSGLGSLLWFGAIVALIPATLWLLKRTPLGGGGSGPMRSVASLSLSASQRVVTVEVGAGDDRRWLVLGITPQSITTLHTMPPQPLAAAAGPGAMASLPAMPAVPGFAALLERMRRARGGIGHAG